VKQSFALLCTFFLKRNYVLSHLSKLTLFTLLSITAPQVFSANNDNKDSDGDGLSDLIEEKIGTEAYLSDTDGDGIPDGIEVGENINKPLDSDNDKRIDALDYDDDNDGLPTILESRNDTDKDGIKDYLDTDSDNDGLADGAEAGFLNQDKNLDGIDDAFDSARLGAVDKNGDGIDDNLKLPDHNNDGIADYLDATFKKQTTVVSKSSETKMPETISKELLENTEKKKVELTKIPLLKTPLIKIPLIKVPEIKTTPEVVKNSGNKTKVVDGPKQISKPTVEVNRYIDTDNDGLLDYQELILGTNIMKRDSDGDKVSDAIEVGMDINSPQDSDGDGIIDALDNDDDNDGILTQFEDINKDGTAINDDTDQDGVPNYLDGNDDGDSRLTKEEGGTKDSDGDGILDYLDKNDDVKGKASTVVANEKLPDEPEVVVLFDGDMSSLPEESNDIAEQAIESAVSNGTLDNNKESLEAKAESKSLKLEKVVINDESETIIKTSEKGKGGIMQWLTSLLPD